MSKIIGFDACDNCYYALRQDGTVVAWAGSGPIVPDAEGYRYMPDDMGKVKQILCMPSTVFSIDSTGSVRGWGLPVDGLLDIPEGLKAKGLYSSNRKCVACIKLDDSVLIWGDGHLLADSIPADLRAKSVALYDTFALAVNLENRVVAWGQIPDGFVIPADLGPVNAVCATPKTGLAIKDTGYAASWKVPAFAGVPVINPSFNFTKLNVIDSYNNCYGVVTAADNRLSAWTYTEGDVIKVLYKEVKKVSTFRCARGLPGSKPKYCIIHKTGLVSILGGKPIERRLPASIAQYSSQSVEEQPLANPSLPIAAPLPLVPVAGPVVANNGVAAQGVGLGAAAAEGEEAEGAEEAGAEEAEEAEADEADEPFDNTVTNPRPDGIIVVKRVSLGSGHGVALTEEGKMICWGTYVPAEAAAAEHVKEVACGLNSIHFINSLNEITILNDGVPIAEVRRKVTKIYNSIDDESIYLSADDHSIVSYTGVDGEETTVGPAYSFGYSKIQKLPLYTAGLTKKNVKTTVRIFGREADLEHIPRPGEEIREKSLKDVSFGLKTAIGIDEEETLYGWSAVSFQGALVLPDGLKKAKFVTSHGSRHAVIKQDDTISVWSYAEDGAIVIDETIPKKLKARYLFINDFAIAAVTLYGKVVVLSDKDSLKAIPAAILGEVGEDASRYLPSLPFNVPILQLATGKGFTLALRKDCTVAGWGDSRRGVLTIPSVLAKYVCAGDGVAGLINMSNTYVGWGEGTGGVPYAELEGQTVKKVVLHKSGLALTLDGNVIVFGLPGDLSADLRARYAVPAGLVGVANIDFWEKEGRRRYAALKNDLSVVVWGDDVVPVPGQAIRVAVGRTAILALRKNGVVEGYGTNDNKELVIPGQLRAREIYAGDACLGLSATNRTFGTWGQDTEDTESYQSSTNWISRGFAFGSMNKKAAYLVYNGNHFGCVNLDGQVILWGKSDNNECDVPSIMKNSLPPFNMGGVVTSLALNWNFGAAVIDGRVQVWGGLHWGQEERLANLLPDENNSDIKSVFSVGQMWFALRNSGEVFYWNTVAGLEFGVESNLLTITKNSDYDKLSVSQNIIVGLIKGSGKVRAFGKRGYSIQKIPASIKPGGVKDVYAGPTCAMAITATDQVVIWGAKYNPCLNIPADLGPVKSVMCSDIYGLAIKLDGTLRLWGGLSAAALESTLATFPTGTFKQVFMTPSHYVGIKEDNSVVEWGGDNLSMEFVMPELLQGAYVCTSGAAGFNAAVTTDGGLAVWGGSSTSGTNNPLENVITVERVAAAAAKPVKKYVAAKNVSVQTSVESEAGVMSIVSGAKQVGLIDMTGHVVTWGSNEYGMEFIPRHLEAVDFLCLGVSCCVARNGQGQYKLWGKVSQGSDLEQLPDELDCKKMVLSEFIGLAINEDDTLLKWGGVPGVAKDRDPTNLPEGLRKVRDVGCYAERCIAADMEGKIHLWGAHLESPVIHEAGGPATLVSAGKRHYAAILEDNTVAGWGDSNEYKQCDVPAGLKGKAVACGPHFTVCIDMEDNVVGWGYPKACVDIPAGLKAVSVSCGYKHVVALKEDGKYVVWGHNVYNTVQLAPAEAFLDPGLTLAHISRYDFRRDFDVATRYKMNRRQITAEKRNDKVFDMVMHKAGRSLFEFLLEHQGNAVIFRYKGEQTATLKSSIEAGFRESGDSYRINVFYECVGPHVMTDAALGTFEFQDIYRQPYYQLNLANGTFLITMDDLERIFKQNQFWILQETGIELKYTASYWCVVAGGPLQSANHCQEGTQKMLYMLVPYSIISEEEEEEEEEPAVPQDIIKVKLGEETTEIDITGEDGKKVSSVKAKYAAIKELAVGRLKFISAGKILADDADVIPGFPIQVMVAPEGGSDLRIKRVRQSRKNRDEFI